MKVAAFHSVKILNDLIGEPIDIELLPIAHRNFEHLQIMLSKDEFLNLLTNDELNEILDAINIGIEYTKDYCYEHDKLNCDCK